jgi:hypothetical protein
MISDGYGPEDQTKIKTKIKTKILVAVRLP